MSTKFFVKTNLVRHVVTMFNKLLVVEHVANISEHNVRTLASNVMRVYGLTRNVWHVSLFDSCYNVMSNNINDS